MRLDCAHDCHHPCKIIAYIPPTPAQVQKKSFARYRSLIRGLPPTPAQAHEESLARAG